MGQIHSEGIVLVPLCFGLLPGDTTYTLLWHHCLRPQAPAGHVTQMLATMSFCAGRCVTGPVCSVRVVLYRSSGRQRTGSRRLLWALLKAALSCCPGQNDNERPV